MATMESAVRGFEKENYVEREILFWDALSEARN
jgi:hypothetical protein